jgi:threonine dehydratase
VKPARLEAPDLRDIEAARNRLAGIAVRTPLVRLQSDRSDVEIFLKLEILQPIGSFKIRGAANALLADPHGLEEGVYTASAGNMAQGIAWSARHLGVKATAIVPEHAPLTKIAAIERLGGIAVKVPYEEWWQVIEEHEHAGTPGRFVHPVSDRRVMAGNGTIGLEILEDLPDVDAIYVPWGGGGLACGISAAVRGSGSSARVFACEIENAAPLAAALEAGAPRLIDYRPSFVDAIGGKTLLSEMWPLAQTFIAGSRIVALSEVAAAIRFLAERQRIVAEGAGATGVAAALAEPSSSTGRPQRIVCIVSGGNLDTERLVKILSGEVP